MKKYVCVFHVQRRGLCGPYTLFTLHMYLLIALCTFMTGPGYIFVHILLELQAYKY